MRHSQTILALCLIPLIGASACSGDDKDSSPAGDGGLLAVSPEIWDEMAVRKVVDVFAFGGFASEAQMKIWADAEPEAAIKEILTFDAFNELLSPPDASGPGVPSEGTLAGLGEYWSSTVASNPVQEGARDNYAIDHSDAPARTWRLAARRTGPNPVRQRIGLFETNYHLAVNQDAGINNWQMTRYYDDLMDTLADDEPYQKVLGVASKSAAVAMQYNHRYNVFVDARFEGNEDFARELYQLFFGILGTVDGEYHELTTIRNTAKALTDMKIENVGETGDTHPDEEVSFGTEEHYPGPLEILGSEVPGATAADRVERLVDLAIEHEESLANLPLIIVQSLADDDIDSREAARIRHTWATMKPRSLLSFLRAYAISTTFHSPDRIKRWSSFERMTRLTNLVTLTRTEAYSGAYATEGQLNREDVRVFRPTRNVFGGQTGPDAMASGDVFRQAWAQSTDLYWFFSRTSMSVDDEVIWTKDWGSIIPAESDGQWRVKGVSEWLWKRFVGDGLKNFGSLERAHVYALVGAGKDLGLFVDENNPLAVWDADALRTRAELKELVRDMEITVLPYDTDDDERHEQLNYRIGMAINFISMTPYAFVQEGR